MFWNSGNAESDRARTVADSYRNDSQALTNEQKESDICAEQMTGSFPFQVPWSDIPKKPHILLQKSLSGKPSGQEDCVSAFAVL